VQHGANVILDYVSRVETHQNEIRELKLALVTAQILQPFDAFPELKPDSEDDDDEMPDDTDQVTYVFPSAPEDAEDIEDEVRSLLAQAASGTATFSDSEDW
jgi:hypothetical protein